jgi:hypothetical protein
MVANAVRVQFNGLTHTFPDELGMLLVSPSGSGLLLQLCSGGNSPAQNKTYSISDAGAAPLPNGAFPADFTYRPASYCIQGGGPPEFDPPAPFPYQSPGPRDGGTATFQSTFGGQDPNGVWSLYVYDFFEDDGGSMTGGWTLDFSGPSADPSPTPPTGSIYGTVAYGTTPPGQAAKFVPGVQFSAAGVINVNSTSDASGLYLLSDLGPGPYTVTPAKFGDANGISALDAARVAQFAADLIPLTANQQLAADATNNGNVSALDAARIAQTAAGLANPGITGQWKFVPTSRSYQSVPHGLSGQDYVAVLVGDVTGNWTPTSVGPSWASGAGLDSQVLNPWRTAEAGKTGRRVSLALTLPGDVDAIAGKTVTVPVYIGETSGSGVVAYDFEVEYDPRVLMPDDSTPWGSGTLSEGWTVVANTEVPGRTKVSAFSTSGLSGAGTLLNLNFTVIGNAEVRTELKWASFDLNEGQVPIRATGDRLFPGISGESVSGVGGMFSIPIGRR